MTKAEHQEFYNLMDAPKMTPLQRVRYDELCEIWEFFHTYGWNNSDCGGFYTRLCQYCRD